MVDRVLAATQILHDLQQLGDDVSRLYANEDESWFSFYPTLPQQETKSWVGQDNKRTRAVKTGLTNKKTLLLICFTPNKKVCIATLPYGETIDSDRYITFLRSVGDHWRKLHRDPTRLSDISVQHDNARPHTSQQTRQFLDSRSVRLIKQPPYSPDYNLCDRWLFAQLKTRLKLSTFTSHQEVRIAATHAFADIPVECFTAQVEKLKMHLVNVIDAHGDYII
jgi:transposase